MGNKEQQTQNRTRKDPRTKSRRKRNIRYKNTPSITAITTDNVSSAITTTSASISINNVTVTCHCHCHLYRHPFN